MWHSGLPVRGVKSWILQAHRLLAICRSTLSHRILFRLKIRKTGARTEFSRDLFLLSVDNILGSKENFLVFGTYVSGSLLFSFFLKTAADDHLLSLRQILVWKARVQMCLPFVQKVKFVHKFSWWLALQWAFIHWFQFKTDQPFNRNPHTSSASNHILVPWNAKISS